MNSLWDAMCGRPNGALTVCEKQNRLWQCILHKIMLLQCPVDKFPILEEGGQTYYPCLEPTPCLMP